MLCIALISSYYGRNEANIEKLTSINIYSSYVFLLIFDSPVTGGLHGICVKQNCDVMHNYGHPLCHKCHYTLHYSWTLQKKLLLLQYNPFVLHNFFSQLSKLSRLR